jgi:hypothetical protein
MKNFLSVFMLFIWMAGIVIAKGFWSTFFAVIIPMWSMYLLVEQIMIKYIL